MNILLENPFKFFANVTMLWSKPSPNLSNFSALITYSSNHWWQLHFGMIRATHLLLSMIEIVSLLFLLSFVTFIFFQFNFAITSKSFPKGKYFSTIFITENGRLFTTSCGRYPTFFKCCTYNYIALTRWYYSTNSTNLKNIIQDINSH